MVKKRWSDLSPAARKAIVAAGTVEFSAKVVMLVDIQRRPGADIRGPKSLWRALALVNLVGPLSYFLFGRRPAR